MKFGLPVLLYPQKLALTSPTSGGRSVGIVRSYTKATKLVSSPDSKALALESTHGSLNEFNPREIHVQFTLKCIALHELW
jgi:hypothetical protein